MGFEWLTVVKAERKPLSWQREPSVLKQLHWLTFGMCKQCMRKVGRMAQVIAEVTRYKLDILGISGSRWTKSGRVKTTTEDTVVYSGREDDSHHQGFVIIIKKGMSKYLMEWMPVNSRTIQARLRIGKLTCPSCNTTHLLITATTEIKKPSSSNCKWRLRTSIVEISCWW